MGVQFPHRKGAFIPKRVYTHYTVCSFQTPFLYWKEGKLCEGKPWDILINPPGTLIYHGPTPNAEIGFINDWFHVEGKDFANLLKNYPLPLDEAFSIHQHHLFQKYATCIFTEFKEQKAGYRSMIDSLMTEMIIAIYRDFTAAHLSKDSFGGIIAVNHAILSNPEHDWTLQEMAKMSGYSVSRFCELYRSMYGISPINDVINQRIQLAKRLLASEQATIGYAAEMCGFNTINYFSKCFKKYTACTPREYIASLHKEES